MIDPLLITRIKQELISNLTKHFEELNLFTKTEEKILKLYDNKITQRLTNIRL